MIDRRCFLGSAFLGTAMAAGMHGCSDAAPRVGGFYAPAEDAPHARTWMCWPSTPSVYGETRAYFESLQEEVGRLAAAIAENEPVTMLAGAKLHETVARLCGPRVTLADVPTDDMWARDTGPVFLRNEAGKKAAVDFNFNGWGAKQRHKRDKRVAGAVAEMAGVDIIRTDLVGEGGGLEYDGEGTLVLTESCWVNPNRNPGMTRDEIEKELIALLGVQKVIWAPGVRDMDLTDGHIDGSIRIVRPGLLLMTVDPYDDTEFGQAQQEAKAILKKATDAHGRAFEIVEIEDAQEPRSTHPEMFTGYANYYVGNGALYTPAFGDSRADALAVAMFERLFPDRRIVALNVDRIYENGGGIHCVTQQEPA